jgi:putative ABC transport system ATP-binding protein
LPINQPPQNIIKAKGLKKVYKRGSEEVVALWDTSLSISAGEFIIIMGPSGSGKSTLLHLLGGIDRPTQGDLIVNGVDLVNVSEAALTRFRRDNIGFVFQFYNLLPSLNALDNVILPLLAKGKSWKASRERGMAMLDQVGLSHRRKHTPSQLSGGEQQRVAIARAMVVEPCVILADEPTGDLDSASANSIIALMVELMERQGVTFIVATHNPLLVQAATHTYELVDGRLSSISDK